MNRKEMKTSSAGGFSLMEMLVVLAIIAILLTAAVPSLVAPIAREQVDESLHLVEQIRGRVSDFYAAQGKLPDSNEEAGLPPGNKLIGNYVSSIELVRGAFHIHFGNKASAVLQDKVLTVRAIIVPDYPATPLSWLCGYSQVPRSMQGADQDFTTVSAQYLPVKCRDTSKK
ncbi:MAG: pilin [Moraxellaceae bacterium]